MRAQIKAEKRRRIDVDLSTKAASTHSHAQADVTNLTTDLGAKEASANKDQANGYAGLNAQSRTTKGAITTDDVIIDDSAKGLVLKDAQGTPHYWRFSIVAGAVALTDLGTSAP